MTSLPVKLSRVSPLLLFTVMALKINNFEGGSINQYPQSHNSDFWKREKWWPTRSRCSEVRHLLLLGRFTPTLIDLQLKRFRVE